MGFVDCLVETVVHYPLVEFGRTRNLVLRSVDAHIDYILGFGASEFEAASQFVDAWRLDKESHSLTAVDLLYSQSAVDVKVQDDVVALRSDSVDLTAQSAIESARIYFLEFDESAFGDTVAEFILR